MHNARRLTVLIMPIFHSPMLTRSEIENYATSMSHSRSPMCFSVKGADADTIRSHSGFSISHASDRHPTAGDLSIQAGIADLAVSPFVRPPQRANLAPIAVGTRASACCRAEATPAPARIADVSFGRGVSHIAPTTEARRTVGSTPTIAANKPRGTATSAI